MKFINCLDVNGVLYGLRRKSDAFELPDAQSIFRSTRFGDHAFDLDRTFLMIVPVRDAAVRAKSVSKGAGSPAAMTVRRNMEGKAVAARLVSREEGWRVFVGKVVNAFLGCKAQAVSFFW